MLETGSLVDGKYKILNLVGKGGMSVVYLAMNERANKQWAIKEVRKDGMQDFEVVKQNLIVETDMLKNLNHPNLPSIIDVIDTRDTFLIVMDYIEGKALDSVLKEFGAQPQEYVIEWAKQLCDVFSYLHTRKPPIIYRDMKPANVMLKPDGNVTLIDFGTAREFKESKAEDTTCLGTRGYASPEQYGGHGQTDARTDIYCLGATLYHLVTGHNPAQPPYEMYPIRQWDPNLSIGLEKIILKCTKYNPQDRYQNCQELLYDLEHYDELDTGYIEEQKKKLKIFIATSAVAAVFGLAALFTGIHAKNLGKSSYDQYIKNANSSTAVEDQQRYLSAAMAIDSSNPEAYETMISLFEGGEEVTDEERKALETMIHTRRGSKEYISELKDGDKEAYADICYDLGRIYFFDYKGTQGKKAAVQWFEEAITEGKDFMDPEKLDRAKIYADIGGYYDSLGKGDDLSGESTNAANYEDFYKQLVELNGYGITRLKKKSSALTLYIEIATQIRNNAENFLTEVDGITADNLKDQLKIIEGRYDELSGGTNTEKKRLEQLKQLVNLAYNSVDIVSDHHNRIDGIDKDADDSEGNDTKLN